jgi:cytochrome c-type biogenesis protein CcmH
MRLSRLAVATVLCVATLCSSLDISAHTTPATSDIGEKVPGAERLEGRLLAPCCWAQTLDIHGSEIANELRREIRTRLKAGESPEAVEQNLVSRYGERIRAVPDRVPLNTMGTLGWLAVVASAGFLTYVLWRWRKRSQSGQVGSSGNRIAGEKEPTEASDERLDSELRRIHDT